MSTIYYLACHDCKCAIAVGQRGPHIWTEPAEHIARVGEWLLEHEHPHRLSYVNEHDFDGRVDGTPSAAEGYKIDGDDKEDHA